MNDQDKLAKYRAGQYAFPAPPVHSTSWGEAAWIRYIDKYGVWL